MNAANVRRAGATTAILATLWACGGADDPTPAPVVDQIDAAIAAVDEFYGAPQEYFEVSADLDRVDVIVAIDGATAAEQTSIDGGVVAPPESVGPATGSTFRGDEVDFDGDRIFDQLRADLDDPVIVDFAITGSPDGGPIYDATVASESGGILLVLLGPSGEIRAVQTS